MANRRTPTMVTVYGTVMSTRNDGKWISHRVEATRPDGNRFTLDVASTTLRRGSVAVRWDPRRMTEPRFVRSTGRMEYASGALLALATAMTAWLLFA